MTQAHNVISYIINSLAFVLAGACLNNALDEITEKGRAEVEAEFMYFRSVLLAFKKTFATRNHVILLKEFEPYEVGFVASVLIRSYLIDRKKKTISSLILWQSVAGCQSVPKHGPSVFIIHIFDYHKNIEI